MQRYSEFRPTAFDVRGLNLPDQQDWLVLPCIRTRDSGELDQSNFETALKMLGGESETVEVHRFGHWGPGWFEIIIAKPGSPAEQTAGEIESSLANYPILDEEDWSNREWGSYQEGWLDYAKRDFVRGLASKFDLRDITSDFLESDCEDEELRKFFESLIPSGEYYHSGDSGISINTRYAIDRCTRKALADFLRQQQATSYAG